MAWVKTISPSEASAELRIDTRGRLAYGLAQKIGLKSGIPVYKKFTEFRPFGDNSGASLRQDDALILKLN